jgi:hypothetical protein
MAEQLEDKILERSADPGFQRRFSSARRIGNQMREA